MKKLLLIFSAVFVSALTYGATEHENWGHANPYAYNLKSSYNATGDTLILSYMLNANAVTSATLNSKARGVQIHFLNDNDEVVYTNTSGGYTKTTDKNKPHIVKIAIKDINIANEYKDKPLRWMVRVWGNELRENPKLVASSTKKPVNAYGIAINSIATHPNFGKVYVSEASPSSTDNKNSLLQFDAATNYVNRIRKYKHYPKELMENRGDTSYFSASLNKEPHRVKISEDGRVFVSCYHPTAGAIVLEYLGNNEFTSIIEPDLTANKNNNNTGTQTDTQDKHFRRVVGMDVKGSGEDLKILVCWINPNDEYRGYIKGPDGVYRHCYDATIECIEYHIGKAEKDGVLISKEQPLGQAIGSYATSVARYKDYYTADHLPGLLYQGYDGGWNSGNRGFVDVVYGANNIIWMKIDYAASVGRVGRIVAFKNGAELKTNHMTQDDNGEGYYGGNGIFYDAENDIIITGAGAGKIKMYTINSNTGVLTEKSAWQLTENTASGDKRIGHWVTAFAKDHANNLYAITQKEWTKGEESYTANVLTIAMPYSGDGKRETLAQETITLSDPIPNILATDLRFAPVPNQPKYRFSFNVNTTPKIAQIRFYKSYGDNGDNDMKKNLAKINADDYQGGNEITPSFVYNIPDTVLKQGEIAVEFDMVGGIVENGVLENTALPRGEWYWSVYVEAPRKSTRFAPIYKQGSTGEDSHCRLHATINNYPETDQFGWIIAAQYDTRAGSAKKGLMLYGFNPTGNSNDEQSTINNSVRYKLIKEYINPTTGTNKFENQRRLAVAPDGKVFIADYGNTNNNTRPLSSVMPFKNGGIWLWDPAKQSESSNTINLSLFLNSTTETANGLAIYKDYNDETKIKLYGTNTYGEFEYHGQYYEEAAQAVNGIFGKNGIKEYELGKPENIYQKETQNTITRQLGAGDGNGNISIVTMDKGIWIAQHRLNDVQYALDQFTSGKEKNLALPDNPFNYILSFVPYNSSTRTWTSCSSNGVSFSASNRTYEFKADASDLTQKTTSPLQSCPGAGLAYRKITAGSQKGEYLYIVNHEGNIVELQITSWNGNKPTIVYKKTLPSAGDKINIPGTTRKTGAISTINFDYAGNLITTSGTEYLGSASQDLIVYTMPYDRVNAREIQAPNSCRFIPERTAYLEPRTEMELTLKQYIQEGNLKPCYLDIFRPMPSTSFSTICLPFDLDMKQLTTEALKDAEVKQYTGLQLSDIGGEKMLELVFEDVPTADGKQILKANTPYIIQPKVRIPGIIQLQEPIQFVAINEQSIEKMTQDEKYAITFKGLIPTEQIEVKYANGQPLTLLLVAENRLAEMVPDEGTKGTIYGFRGYFELNKPLNGIAARITPKQSVSTSTTIIVDGKRVNINKYLREGRVYIRMGDTLYTIDGQKVK